MPEYDVLRRLLSDRPIAFHPELARALGGVHEALLFQQIAYWSDKGSDPDGWIYKTTADLRAETTLNRDQQDKARAQLVGCGVLEAVRRGMPARMHYRIRWEPLFRLLDKQVCSPPTNSAPTVDEPVCSPSADKSADGRQALIGAKSTAKSTQRNAATKTGEKREVAPAPPRPRFGEVSAEEWAAWCDTQDAARQAARRLARAVDRGAS